MRIVIAALATACFASLTSCADEPPTPTVDASAPSVTDPYTGPMYVAPDYSDNATVIERTGAAGRALQCDQPPWAGGGGNYDTGPESIQDGPTRALQNFLEQEPGWPPLPRSGYQVERDDGNRVLLSYDVDGRTKVAVIVAKGMRDGADHTGWGVEAWAECDPAELPASVTDGGNLGVWTDAAGARVPVAEIRSYQGPEHCDWQDITFLELGPENRPTRYVRDVDGQLADFLTTTYAAGVRLPDDAIDTGYRRAGQELWGVPRGEAVYLVRTDSPGDVERWPRDKRGIGCE